MTSHNSLLYTNKSDVYAHHNLDISYTFICYVLNKMQVIPTRRLQQRQWQTIIIIIIIIIIHPWHLASGAVSIIVDYQLTTVEFAHDFYLDVELF